MLLALASFVSAAPLALVMAFGCAPPAAFDCWPDARRWPCQFLLPPPPCAASEDDGGVKRSAAFGTLRTSLRSSMVTVRLAVMPGFNFWSGLLTSMTTL